MASMLEIYLQNHEAAAQAGHDLARRAAAGQRHKPYAAQLRTLAADVGQDRDRLRAIIAGAGLRPAPLLGLALRLGERVGRLKPNGRILRRSPLSDLFEVEALLDAVHAKRAGWQALAAAAPATGDPDEIADLLHRADAQIAVLQGLHEQVASEVLRR